MKLTLVLLPLTLAACQKNANEGPVGVVTVDSIVHARELQPLAANSRWTYQVSVAGEGGPCAAGDHSSTLEPGKLVTEQAVFTQTSFCDDSKVQVSRAGDQIQELVDGSWRTTLAMPLQEGVTWESAPGKRFHWHRIGWVKVLAGTFPECWERIEEGGSNRARVYCAGVGLVSEVAPEYVAELKELALR